MTPSLGISRSLPSLIRKHHESLKCGADPHFPDFSSICHKKEPMCSYAYAIRTEMSSSLNWETRRHFHSLKSYNYALCIWKDQWVYKVHKSETEVNSSPPHISQKHFNGPMHCKRWHIYYTISMTKSMSDRVRRIQEVDRQRKLNNCNIYIRKW